MKFFLVTTDHFSDKIWFKEDDDFKASMNCVAVVSVITGVNVLAFILMSTHVHFVLYCTRSDAKLFIDTFKKLYGAYYCRKYKTSGYFRRLSVDIREIPNESEAVEKAIAYVQMNCVAANICAAPYYYQWGTGSCFYNGNPSPGKRVDEFSRRAQIRIVKSNVVLPAHFMIGENGFILPESYINTKLVESLFKSPKRYNYFLVSSSKAKKVMENDASPSFRDQNILAAAKDLCHSLFRSEGLHVLNREQKSELLKQLRYRFSADINQLCRVVGLSYQETANLLEM